MKKILIICASLFLLANISFAQMYNPGNFTSGTSTIETLRNRYTNQQLKTMLEGTQISRNMYSRGDLGFVFTDPNNSSQILVTDSDVNVILYEYIKLLRSEITNMKQRLQTAGIP